MTFRHQTGRYLNLLTRARQVTTSTTETLFPVSNAYDGNSLSPVIWLALSSDVYVRADLAFDDYGAFEGSFSAGIPPGWTSGHSGGTSSKETSLTAAGTGALKLTTTGSSDVAQIYRDYPVAPGEELRIIAQMRTDNLSGSPVVACRVYDTNSRTYYDGSTGTWTAAAADAFSQSTVATYQAKSVTFTVPRGQGDAATLRVFLRMTGPAALTRSTYVDEFYIHPTWDCLALIGHNAESGAAVALQSSADGSSYTTVATATHRRPNLYALASSRQTTRWAGLLIPGANVDQLYAGEIVFAQLATPGHSWSDALPTTWTPRQIRTQGPSGRARVRSLSTDMPRRVSFNFKIPSETIRTALLDDFALRSRGGEFATFAIPDTDRPDCFYGRLTDSFETSRAELSVMETMSITLEEDGFPTVGLGV